MTPIQFMSSGLAVGNIGLFSPALCRISASMSTSTHLSKKACCSGRVSVSMLDAVWYARNPRSHDSSSAGVASLVSLAGSSADCTLNPPLCTACVGCGAGAACSASSMRLMASIALRMTRSVSV